MTNHTMIHCFLKEFFSKIMVENVVDTSICIMDVKVYDLDTNFTIYYCKESNLMIITVYFSF